MLYNLSSPHAAPVIRFNYTTLMPIKFGVAQPIHCRLDFEHLYCIVCDVVKLCTKFKRNRTILSGVIVI